MVFPTFLLIYYSMEMVRMVNFEKLFYTIDELYEILPLGKNSLYSLVKREGFPKVIVGRKILIPVKGFNLWIEQNSVF